MLTARAAAAKEARKTFAIGLTHGAILKRPSVDWTWTHRLIFPMAEMILFAFLAFAIDFVLARTASAIINFSTLIDRMFVWARHLPTVLTIITVRTNFAITVGELVKSGKALALKFGDAGVL